MEALRTNPNGGVVRFGVYEVDLATAELRKQGTLLRLQEQPFQILCALLERPGDVVTREELIGRLWVDGTVVDYDRGLNAAVTRLRQVLSDSAESPRYVETVVRRGYRFVAPVEGSSALVAAPGQPKAVSRWPWALAALVSLGLLAVLGVWRVNPGRSEAVSNEPVAVVPLTMEPGVETDVSFSADGNQIAYAWRAPGADEPRIYVRQVGVGDPVRLTKGSSGEYSPVWSRDGRYIAFLRPVDAERLALMLAPVLGTGPERKLIDLPSPSTRRIKDGGLTRSLDWTPDSRYLIVAAFRQGANRLGPYGPMGLMRIAIETGEPRWIHEPPAKLTGGSTDSPAVSPDGRTLAFVKAFSGAAREIHLQPLGSEAEPAGPAFSLKIDRWCQSLAWTNDGKSVLFDGSPSGLYRIEARPGAKVEVLHAAGTERVRMPAVARDGRVAWTREFRDDNVWEVNLASGSFRQVIGSTAVDRSAEYSPDGKRIALQSRRSGTAQIWVCDSDGTRCVQMTEMKGDAGSPSWSPDGSQLAFDAEGGNGHYDIYTVNVAGGAPRRLTTFMADNAGPFWSRDGRSIYFFSARTGKLQTWKIPATGGAEVLVTAGGGISARESFDGRYLYYSRTSGGINPSTKAELFRSNLDGSGETKLVEEIVGRAFTVTRDHFYYLRWGEGSRASLRSYAFATGADQLVARTPKQVGYGLSISPDGRTAILTQVDSEGSDVVMVKGFR